MGLSFAVVLVFMLFILAAAGVMLWTMNKEPRKNSVALPIIGSGKKQPGSKSALHYRHITELIKIKPVAPGIIYTGGKYLGYARIEGTNFSILSDGEQDTKESVLIGLQNQFDFPLQYVTSTVVTDTGQIAGIVRDYASTCTNQDLAAYSAAYATELEQMKAWRQAMAQVSWLAVSDTGAGGDPAQNIYNKMAQLQELFRSRAGIILTPLTTTGEVIDALQQIMLPQRLTPASQTAALGLNPVHYSDRELVNIS